MSTIAFDYNSALATLAPTFQTAIKATIDAESDPLKRVQAQKDAITVQKGMYTDMKNDLDGLQTAVQSLISTQAFYGLGSVLKPTVTPGAGGGTVLTAATNGTPTAGEYDIAVTQLAKAESRASEAAPNADIALGKSGTFWMGGNGTAAVQSIASNGSYTAFVPNNSVIAASTSTTASGHDELGTGDYSLEVRDMGGSRQFRLVNADGTAMSIRSTDGSSYTTAWQVMPTGSYDTGRGLTLSLNSSGSTGSTALHYTAQGVAINISATDTQRTIANAINAAAQPEGRDFTASIVGGKLVLTGAQTGENHTMLFTDNAGLGFGKNLQDAQNAKFSINGMDVERAANTNLTDVIDGMTINLASDAENKSAHLSIAGTTTSAVSTMNTFVNSFNTAFTYLTGKMATTTSTSGGSTTYTRGALAGDNVFRSLRTSMLDQMNRITANSGSFDNLADIGLTFDSNLKLTFDANKFASAMQDHPGDVKALLDTAMGTFNNTLSSFTGSQGSLQTTMDSMDEQSKTFDDRITKYNDSITMREQSLVEQYTEMQTTLAELGYQAQEFGINISGGNVTGSSNINLLA